MRFGRRVLIAALLVIFVLSAFSFPRAGIKGGRPIARAQVVCNPLGYPGGEGEWLISPPDDTMTDKGETCWYSHTWEETESTLSDPWGKCKGCHDGDLSSKWNE